MCAHVDPTPNLLTEDVTCSDEARTHILKKDLDQISGDVFRLDHLVSKAAHALPAFELWKHSTLTKQLRSALIDLRAKKLPRQPFKFSNEDRIIIVDDPLEQVRVFCSRCLCDGICSI